MNPAATPEPHRDIDPARVAGAVGIDTSTGADYRFTDAYGVTYTGVPAHLALSALARPDLTGTVYPDRPAVAAGIRTTARILVDWFTSPHTDPQHAAEFAALSPLRVCELVVHLYLHGNAVELKRVGTESLRYYTDHLLHDPVPSDDHPLPRLADQPYRTLRDTEVSWTRLQVTATAPGRDDVVVVPMRIHASEDVHWTFTAPVQVPTEQINELLMDPDHLTGDYLADNRELIDDYLIPSAGHAHEGLRVTGRLANPGTTALDTEPVRTGKVEMFSAGRDPDAAPGSASSAGRALADRFVGAEDRIFGVEAVIDTDFAH